MDTAQKAGHTQVLVNIRPMNPFPITHKLEIRPLFGTRIEEPRKPRQGGGDGASIL